jgi:hypothetical protein
MTAAQFRRLALSYPGVIEGAHMGHADFRVVGKVFATLGYPNEKFAMVKLSPQDQSLIMRDHAAVFAPAAGKWGASGSTIVTLSMANSATVSSALEAAWRNRAPKALIAEFEDRPARRS